MTTNTTPIYILMCEKAVEIQAGHVWAKYDLIVREKEYYRTNPFVFPYDEQWIGNRKRWLWLPDQSQLQAMVHPEVTDWVKVLLFADYLKENKHKIKDSMEQLGLAFLMKEKYSKVWDGADWVANA